MLLGGAMVCSGLNCCVVFHCMAMTQCADGHVGRVLVGASAQMLPASVLGAPEFTPRSGVAGLWNGGAFALGDTAKQFSKVFISIYTPTATHQDLPIFGIIDV